MDKVDETLNALFEAYFREKCPQCSGTTWVIDKGVARRCVCFVQDLDHNRKAYAGIPEAMMECTLQNFYPQNDNQRAALLGADRYVKNFEESFGRGSGLLLRGPVGVGKTHLAIAVLKALIEKGFVGVFLNFVHFIEQIKQSFDPNTDLAEPDITRRLRNCHVVVMDELGAVRPTDFVFDKLYDIVNQCLSRNLALIFTTNYPDEVSVSRSRITHRSNFDSVDELAKPSLPRDRSEARFTPLSERISERLRSRILEKCLDVTMEGADYRLQKKGGKSKVRH